MKTIHIQGQLRTEFGKKATHQLRSQENVPGVIYGGTKEINFYAPVKQFKSLIYTSEFQLVEITVGADKFNCILKDLQFNKVTDELIHIDFLELVESKKVKANLPLKYTGTSIGVKSGGKLVLKMKSIKVKTLPIHLKEFVEIDITNLDLNQNIRIEDIKEPNFEILNSARIPIASVVLT
ncbi:MAG: 50S ribosomal protein L25, partial [Sediminibacterium sp.]|nr:50S ribosomal protein L25 [Sediminibacterium sp.]